MLLSLLPCTLKAHVSIWQITPCQFAPNGDQACLSRIILSTSRLHLRRLFSGSIGRVSESKNHILSLPLLLVLFASLDRALPRLCTRNTRRYALGPSSFVVEIASNDGSLLQCFKELGIAVLGVEPAANVAAHATIKGIPTEVAFFGGDTARRLAAEGRSADLIAANNVLAHAPDLNDFVAGFKILLKPNGTFRCRLNSPISSI